MACVPAFACFVSEFGHDNVHACASCCVQVAGQVGCNHVLRFLLNQQHSEVMLDHANNNTGMTPLMLAAAGGHAKCAQTLLER